MPQENKINQSVFSYLYNVVTNVLLCYLLPLLSRSCNFKDIVTSFDSIDLKTFFLFKRAFLYFTMVLFSNDYVCVFRIKHDISVAKLLFLFIIFVYFLDLLLPGDKCLALHMKARSPFIKKSNVSHTSVKLNITHY